jgi:hypothetical protein
MTDLRQFARNQPCMVRLEGVCNHVPATTVLGHVRMIGISGMGHKAADMLGAWVCSACHQACDTLQWDGQRFERDYVELAFLRGVMRTQAELIRREVIGELP